jgi:hypothetical protein
MTCVACPKSADTINKVLLNADGDFACSKECADKYNREKADFFNRIVHSEDLTERYLKGEDV